MAPSKALTVSGQFYFLMGVSRTPHATFRDGRPLTIQQSHTIQCDGSGGHNDEDYEYLFHGPAFYMNAVQGS